MTQYREYVWKSDSFVCYFCLIVCLHAREAASDARRTPANTFMLLHLPTAASNMSIKGREDNYASW